MLMAQRANLFVTVYINTLYIALYDTSVGLKDGLYGSVIKSRFYNATALLSNYA